MVLQAQNPRRRAALPRFAGIIPAGHGLKSKCPAGASFSAHVV